MSFLIALFIIGFSIIYFVKNPKKVLKEKCLGDKLLHIGFTGGFVFFLIVIIGVIIEETYCTDTWVIWVPFGIMVAFLMLPIIALMAPEYFKNKK